jgi:integrase/recombinase XerC
MLNLEPYLLHFHQYLDVEKKYSKNTSVAYCNDVSEFQDFLNDTQQEVLVKNVSYALIRSWMVFLMDASIGPKTINRKMSALKCYYKYLIKTDQLKDTPMDGHKSIRFSKVKQIPFSEDEMSELFASFPKEQDFKNTRDRLILELFYCTGIRRTELLNLEEKNVDLLNNTLKVLGKRNKERIIPLITQVIPFLTSYLKEKNKITFINGSKYFLVNNKNEKLSESYVYRLVKKYLGFASEKVKRSPHILRHTFATHLINSGAAINSVKELLGHSSLASTQVYTHANLKELQIAHKKAHPRNKE